MEELKNENVAEQPVEEAVVEQRPSTKYGRTAYQQQMQEEQAAQGEPAQGEPVQGQPQQNNYQYWEGSQNPYSQNMNQQNTNQQYQQNPYQQYQNPYNAYTPYEEPKPAVKNTFAYILMVLVAIAGVATFIMNMMSSQAYSITSSIEELVDTILVIADQPLFVVVSTINDFVGWVIIALLVVDIIQLYKGGKKITGAILFAIFLRPAYFIWRAHLLGQKKTGAIVYTVVYYGLMAVEYVILFAGAMDMVMRTMY